MNILEGGTTRGKRCVSIFLLSRFQRSQRVESKKKEREEGEGRKTCVGKKKSQTRQGENKAETNVFEKWRRIIRTLREVDRLIT